MAALPIPDEFVTHPDSRLLIQLVDEISRFFAQTNASILQTHQTSLLTAIKTMCRLKSWLSVVLMWSCMSHVSAIGIVPVGCGNGKMDLDKVDMDFHFNNSRRTLSVCDGCVIIHDLEGNVPIPIPNFPAIPPHIMPPELVFIVTDVTVETAIELWRYVWNTTATKVCVFADHDNASRFADALEVVPIVRGCRTVRVPNGHVMPVLTHQRVVNLFS